MKDKRVKLKDKRAKLKGECEKMKDKRVKGKASEAGTDFSSGVKGKDYG
jgi:hypothetical protein